MFIFCNLIQVISFIFFYMSLEYSDPNWLVIFHYLECSIYMYIKHILMFMYIHLCSFILTYIQFSSVI